MISVVIAAYNCEKYVEKCLKSIQNQTYGDFEVIVVVDGATDKTLEICEAFALLDNRFKIIWRENGGPAAARNTGLEYCTGEYITFIDSDDYVDDCFLESLHDAITEDDCDISVCGYVFEDENGKEEYCVRLQKKITDNVTFLNGMLVPPNNCYAAFTCNKLYKAEIIKKYNVRFPDEKKYMFEDCFFNYNYLKHANKASFATSSPYHYVSRENVGMVRGILDNGQLSDKWFCYTDVFKRICEDDYKEFSVFKSQIKIIRVWHSATAVRVLAYYGKSDTCEYKNMRKYIWENMFAYLKAPYISIKKKLGMLITYFAPKLAFRLWRG